MRLGGVPNGVAIPPIDAPQAMAMQIAAANPGTACRCSRRATSASATGSMISVAAVLAIHIEASAVASSMPSTSRRGEVPMRSSTASASRRCRPQRSMASAAMKPAIISRMKRSM